MTWVDAAPSAESIVDGGVWPLRGPVFAYTGEADTGGEVSTAGYGAASNRRRSRNSLYRSLFRLSLRDRRYDDVVDSRRGWHAQGVLSIAAPPD